MKENKFQKDVKKQLKSQAAFVINVHGHLMQKAGLPDLLIIHKDWKGWLELKTGAAELKKNQASPIQRIQAAKIELRNMPVYVLRCVEVSSGAEFTYSKDVKYTLENFQEQVMQTFYELKELLGVLMDLDLYKWSEG